MTKHVHIEPAKPNRQFAEKVRDGIAGLYMANEPYIESNRTSYRVHFSVHCMNENGFWDGWQSMKLILHKTKPVNQWTLQYGPDRYLGRKYNLKTELEPMLAEIIEDAANETYTQL